MDRRKFIFNVGGSIIPLVLSSSSLTKNNVPSNFERANYLSLYPESSESINKPHPNGKRSPFGWDYFEISKDGQKLNIRGNYKSKLRTSVNIYLRIHVAHEIRNIREIIIRIGGTKDIIGKMSIWYANSLQIFECKLNVDLELLISQGIILEQISNTDEALYCYIMGLNPGSHIFVDDESYSADIFKRFITNLSSFWTLQPFGWMEGCITDGLEALINIDRYAYLASNLKKRIELFLPDSKTLKYEDNKGEPYLNYFNSDEGGLPFAAIVKFFPKHPSIKLFTDYCEQRIQNGTTITNYLKTEGCYHLAYPLATVGKVLQNNELCEIAIIEILESIKYLTTDNKIIQGASKDGSATNFVNWARGYAWFLLGLVQTYKIISTIKDFRNDVRLERIREAFEYYGNLALSFQQADNTWLAYIDKEDTYFDASGTAGIASALMYGHRLGFKVAFDKNSQMKTLRTLEQNLTPDGFLKNCSQINRGGEELQKGPYRVISQYALGLMAHLYL